MTAQIRCFTDKDLPILVKMLNESFKDAYERRLHSEEGLRSWIQEGKLKILMFEENGEVMGSVTYNDGYWGEEIEWLSVRETPNRRLVENMLVKEAEKYVKRGMVFAAVDAGSPKIANWMQRGYRQEGGLYHMIARLDARKTLPKIPEGTILRSLQSEEEKKFVDAVNVGFGTERVKLGAIQYWKTENPPFDEGWISVAEINGKIVSAVVAKPDTNYSKFFNVKRGYLGPAATLPEHRGKNLASVLTVRAMNLLFEKGMNSVALYTSETNIPSVTLLRKIGFEVGHSWKFMRKNLTNQC
jgi:ribosomal protein S18 acetylase RimI-like enzyme